jgi:cyclic-di-AMP phosphodiesterase PgpH
MKRFYKWFKRNRLYINRTFLFSVAVAFVYFIFPSEGRFGKDFEKNKPWKHEDLLAPFDFPIYKTQEQLSRERDSLLSGLGAYFEFDTSVLGIQQEKIYKALLNVLNDSVLPPRIDTTFHKYVAQPIEGIYNTGILELVDLSQYSREYIAVVKNNIAYDVELETLYTEKTAYEHLIQSVNTLLERHKLGQMQKLKAFLSEYNFNQLIEPNLAFDYDKTLKARNERENQLSIYEGKVQEDERIISQGEVVDARKFQILESLKTEYESWIGHSTNVFLIVLGKLIFIAVTFLIVFLFLFHFRFEVLADSRKSVFIVFISTLFVSIPAVFKLLDLDFLLYVIPFAILPIVIRTFYDDRLAIFMHIVTIFLVGYIVPKPFEFIFMNFIAGLVAIFSFSNMYRRRKLFITSLLVMLSYSVVYFALNVVSTGNLMDIETKNFIRFAINGLFITLIYFIIYIFEHMFGFLSDVTLMELSDTNQDLLRKLAQEAPGTFQHSLQVANLAEEAVFNINGNALLVRTGALYHDIGKMFNPSYFIENQKHNHNPHDAHPHDVSAKIIIEHVTKGVELAKKHNLPPQVIDFIRTHHGTTTVRYFYKSFINQNPGVKVDQEKFRYPGPIPFSKETAVLMMADSVEAASRSLTDLNEETINNLVESIIDYQMAEDQFVNADITFKDISKIKEIFKKKLINIYHIRIKYPE